MNTPSTTHEIHPEEENPAGPPAESDELPCPAAEHRSVALLLEDGRLVNIQANLCIGRSPQCDLVLDDRRVSRRHAAVHVENGVEYWLSDLGGPNGIYLNGHRINAAARLRHGDDIRIVTHHLKFLDLDQIHHPSPNTPTTRSDSFDRTLTEFSRDQRWLLVADIVDAAGLSIRLELEQYRGQIDRWIRACQSVVERTGGTVNALAGDGFLASWPLSEVGALEIRDVLGALDALRGQEPFTFRVVLHLGQVLVGGFGVSGEERLSGREVNFVFRMEKVAARMELPVLFSRESAALLGKLLILRPVAPMSIRGYPGEVEFYTPSS